VKAVYCHALSKDAAKADPQEVQRGRNLAAAAKAAGVQHVVYNGAGGYGSGCPMTQVGAVPASHHPCTALHASVCTTLCT
jgi:nucleoside-diphosphate-sugar epimerase